jgi:hypothetical protein
MSSKIIGWCDSSKNSIFSEYLRILPISEEEANILKIEKLIESKRITVVDTDIIELENLLTKLRSNFLQL